MTKKQKKKLEKNILKLSIAFFSISLVFGLATGYYKKIDKDRITQRLYQEQELYKLQSMRQLNYQIRHSLINLNDQVSPSN